MHKNKNKKTVYVRGGLKKWRKKGEV